MKSLLAPEQIASPSVGKAKHQRASLSSLIGLSAGALGWTSLASADDEGRELQTLILPDTYSALDDGTVILQLETGEQLTLTSDQYVMLDGGLLLVVDELAQNSVAELPVLGSLRTQLFTEVQPVRSPDGSIVEASSQHPLWSGEGSAPRLFEEIDIQRFEIAQDQQEEEDGDEGLFLGGAGSALIGLGVTTLGMMNSGGADAEDESTDGGGSDGGGSDGGGGSGGSGLSPSSFLAARLDASGTFQAGTSVSSAGDVDGDGKDDILIGEPGFNGVAGATYLVFGSYLETDPQTVDLANLGSNNGVRLDGIDASDESGKSVSSAGDVDGDGLDDILIGARFADPNGTMSGETYLVFGKSLDGYGGYANADASDDITLTNGGVDLGNLAAHGVRLDGIAANDNSGFSVSSAGDVDGDGKDDILIGAYKADGSAGDTYLVFGSYLATNPGTVDLVSLGGNGVRLDGIDANDKSGFSVSSAGDVDGDGKDDILIGAYQADGVAGATYLVFGSYLATNPGTVDLGSLGGNGVRLDGIDASDKTGWSVSSAGDVDGDGLDDILIGAKEADSSDSSTGETYLVFGKSLDGYGGYANADASDDITLTNGGVDLGSLGANGVRLDGIDASDTSGYSVSSAGDVDGDLLDDILIGAPGLLSSADGETYLVFGSYLATNPGTVDLGNLGGNGVRLEGSGGRNGYSVSSAGDVDGDGKDDILIGAARANSSNGEVYLISGETLDLAADGTGVQTPGVIDLAVDLGL